ncbi:MFS transporter [Mucilaginibacter sp. UC70_90]
MFLINTTILKAISRYVTQPNFPTFKPVMEAKNNKKTIWAWCMFDWANQSYNIVITSTIFPAYFVEVTKFNSKNTQMVTFLGHRYVNTVLSNYILGLSYLIVAAILPILTSIADYRGNKNHTCNYLPGWVVWLVQACFSLSPAVDWKFRCFALDWLL